MRILYAASEANPFAKSGGLADVAGALPKALVKDGVDARVIMPLYGDLKFRDKLEYVTNYSVPVGWRSQYCGLFKAEVDGVTYYFLDNEYYFKRRGLYGFYDDGERFAFFSRAVLETLFYIDFTPDIINCNDWQTALVPVYLNLYYRHLDKFNRIKTVFTIHNIAYHIVHAWIEEKGYGMGQVMNTLRLALVGAGKGPGMYDVTSFIGKAECLKRIDNLLNNLKPAE